MGCTVTTVVGGMEADTVKRLIMHIEKIERMEEERTQTGELIKDEFAVAKAAGFDPKVMKIVLRLRKRDNDDIEEEETLVQTYRSALGMV
jgi:uncharacterized protein (UPF0335 family)